MQGELPLQASPVKFRGEGRWSVGWWEGDEEERIRTGLELEAAQRLEFTASLPIATSSQNTRTLPCLPTVGMELRAK